MDTIKEPEIDPERHTNYLYNESFDLKSDGKFTFAEPFDLRPTVELSEEM